MAEAAEPPEDQEPQERIQAVQMRVRRIAERALWDRLAEDLAQQMTRGGPQAAETLAGLMAQVAGELAEVGLWGLCSVVWAQARLYHSWELSCCRGYSCRLLRVEACGRPPGHAGQMVAEAADVQALPPNARQLIQQLEPLHHVADVTRALTGPQASCSDLTESSTLAGRSQHPPVACGNRPATLAPYPSEPACINPAGIMSPILFLTCL